MKYIVLDMDSSVSPTHGDQEGSAWNGHFDCAAITPTFCSTSSGCWNAAPCAMATSTGDGWRDVLDPVIARYAERDLGGRFFRADAAYAIPAIYERLEEARFFYAIRLPANAVLKDKIAHRNAPCRAAVTDQGQAVLRGIRVSARPGTRNAG
ncbi:transposase [Pseudogemmobacter bohemicus]|uniref:transposase n=1 Tax=Pseudogemmobacter bohemicus TaxID=2250708 RepID=UPI0022B84A6C|nr:transposase [Pseudogemmobacter bohemicus]